MIIRGINGGITMEFNFKDNHAESDFAFGPLTISGDEELGIRPFQLLVSSIAGCSGLVFKKIIDKQRMDITDLTITAEVQRDDANANKITQIRLLFKITGKELNEKKLQRNLALSRKNCSMIRSVEDSIEIIEELELIEL